MRSSASPTSNLYFSIAHLPFYIDFLKSIILFLSGKVKKNISKKSDICY
uniref:Uncharacterized protein n=1 Tax=Siphoviridae sp. ctbQZ1 TaxID=2827581 RepID=A0A8S5LNB9_9CAUD|nr:MAG TPA: hypothetical protein [Siphoviridae sp. ctbQZ1]